MCVAVCVRNAPESNSFQAVSVSRLLVGDSDRIGRKSVGTGTHRIQRQVQVPHHEVGVLENAWQGEETEATPTASSRAPSIHTEGNAKKKKENTF